jgi:predicted alpha/beta-fold hydrolase
MRRYPHELKPPLWARSGHAQTILGHVLPSPGRHIGLDAGDRQLTIALDDGDRLVGYACTPTIPDSGVRVHLFHGLSGDVNAEYMRRTAAVMTLAGHEVWAFNHRGTGEGAGLAKGIYHSGRSDDLAAVLTKSRAERPDQLQLVIGFSLSGNAALKLAAELGEDTSAGPDGILAINPPADLEATSLRIQTGLNRLYERRFVRRLARTLQGRPGAPAIPSRASLWDVDELVTAPLGGFADARDYYARCSTVDRLGAIQLSTVILTAADDPFVDAHSIASAPRSPAVHLHVEATGGHVGYLESRGGLRAGRWLDGALAHYIRELITEARTKDAAPHASAEAPT